MGCRVSQRQRREFSMAMSAAVILRRNVSSFGGFSPRAGRLQDFSEIY
jgi:hypothetical protein